MNEFIWMARVMDIAKHAKSKVSVLFGSVISESKVTATTDLRRWFEEMEQDVIFIQVEACVKNSVIQVAALDSAFLR